MKILILLLSMAISSWVHASIGKTVTLKGKVIIVDTDKVVLNSDNHRVTIPAKFVKDQFTVGEMAYIDVPEKEMKSVKMEPLTPSPKKPAKKK